MSERLLQTVGKQALRKQLLLDVTMVESVATSRFSLGSVFNPDTTTTKKLTRI